MMAKLLEFSDLRLDPRHQSMHLWSSPRTKGSIIKFHSVQFNSVAKSCSTLCDPMNHNTPGLPVHHQLLKFTQTNVHRVGDAIQPSHPLSLPSPPAPNPSSIRVFSKESTLHMRFAKVLEFQLQHQSFQ